MKLLFFVYEFFKPQNFPGVYRKLFYMSAQCKVYDTRLQTYSRERVNECARWRNAPESKKTCMCWVSSFHWNEQEPSWSLISSSLMTPMKYTMKVSKYTKNLSLQIFHKEGNVFNMFVRPLGCTQLVLVRNSECK